MSLYSAKHISQQLIVIENLLFCGYLRLLRSELIKSVVRSKKEATAGQHAK